ncbi:MAG TPA: bifunctional glutamine-synthetase adenylyltransferase/deadenyltransferase, partial [Agromyces sp.]|nr:bifunctional glutamine-synthetase adenylyltransferase/deadenyltransferase [Agromyces sp.]
MSRQAPTLGRLARAGFDDLDRSAVALDALSASTGIDPDRLLTALGSAADPDEALAAMQRLHDRAPAEVAAVLGQDASAERMSRLLGASRGFADFLVRHPRELAVFRQVPAAPPTVDEGRAAMLDAVDGIPAAADILDAAA